METNLNQDVVSTETTVDVGSNDTNVDNVETTPSEDNYDAFLDGLTDGSITTNESEEDETSSDESNDDVNENEDESIEEENDDEQSDESNEDETIDSTNFLKIKFNGEELTLSKEEAIELAQKGKNYDKKEQQYKEALAKNEKYEQALNSKVMVAIQKLAKESGLNADQLGDYLEQQMEQAKFGAIYSKLQKEYPNADNDTLQALAKEMFKNQTAERQQKAVLEQANSNQRMEQQAEKELKEFAEKYPDFKEEDLTDEMLNDIRSGVPIIQAYEKCLLAKEVAENKKLQEELNKLKEKNKAIETNAKVSKKSSGSLKGNGTNNLGSSDPFLDGLFGK